QQATANSCDNAGKSALKKKDYKTAQAHYEQSLKARLEIYGTEPHPDTAKSYMGLGLACRGLKDYQKALDYLKQSLEIRLRVNGTKAHPSVATSYHNLGNVCRDQESYRDAEHYYEQALEIFQKCVNKDDRRIKLVTKNLGQIRGAIAQKKSAAVDHDSQAEACLKQQDYKQAQVHYAQALEMRQKLYGTKPHAEVAKSYYHLGQVHFAQRNYEEATEHYEKAQSIYIECLGEDHPDTQRTAAALEEVYMAFSLEEEETAAQDAKQLTTQTE
ncbi:MAG: tetratricopeptide repeat protein, partial [Bacteroidota bacterium]